MNRFHLDCINYLLANGWERDLDGWEWTYRKGFVHRVQTDSIGEALEYQFSWEEDAEPNSEPEV